jgi:formylglycine-generating enzyme required for sulfatase activity
MRIRIDIEIPQWTKWLTSGIAIGVVLGVGAARVYADTVSVKTDWKTDDTLLATDLNANFANLKAAVDQLKHPSCPEDYTQDTTAGGIVLCKKGVDEVVKVGTNNTVFWIDRYEASIWASASPVVGTTVEFGSSGNDYPGSFPVNGEYTTPLYALSVTGVMPSGYATWFQAEAACEASGKRLPTGQEWLRAARGTPDLNKTSPNGPDCNNISQSALRQTGLGTACASAWGAQDMIGNLGEWTADWYAGLGGVTGNFSATWPGSAFKGDGTWNIASAASEGAALLAGLPAAAVRGGNDGLSPTTAGRFAVILTEAPSASVFVIGFRCVLTH